MKFTIKELKEAGVWKDIIEARRYTEGELCLMDDDTEITLRKNDGFRLVLDPETFKKSSDKDVFGRERKGDSR